MPYFCTCYNICMVRIRTVAIVAALTSFLAPALALAAGGLPSQIVTCTGVNCSVCDLAQLGQNVLNTGIYIAVFLSAVLFAYAGGKMAFAQGNMSEISAARSMFTNVAIGLVIILAGWLVGSDTSFGPWNRICNTTADIPTEHFYV